MTRHGLTRAVLAGLVAGQDVSPAHFTSTWIASEVCSAADSSGRKGQCVHSDGMSRNPVARTSAHEAASPPGFNPGTNRFIVRSSEPPRDLRIQRLRPFPGWVKNFIGEWTDTTLRAILVVVVGQLARDLLSVYTVADMPGAVDLVDVEFATLVSSSAIESMRRNGRVVKCGVLENRRLEF
jgi:hypothetical protein